MSTIAIIGIVTTGLFLLVMLAVIKQTIEKNSKDKRRFHSGLLARARSFEHMLSGFPEGFLNQNLKMLVCKCILQVYEQLIQVEPENSQHTATAELIKQQLKDLSEKPSTNKPVRLTDTQQIKDVQKSLKNLFNFISKLIESKKISVKEGKVYAKQIHQLMTQSSVDALIQAKTQVLQEGKPRLAIHYLQMIVEKLTKENGDGFFTDSINKYSEEILQLDEQALNKEKEMEEHEENASTELDEVNKDSEAWKKKALYD